MVDRKLTVERVIKIWNDEGGDHFYIGPDGDGLDLVELRSVSEHGKIGERFTMPKEDAILIAKSILELYDKQ